jgi:hypothetical protein
MFVASVSQEHRFSISSAFLSLWALAATAYFSSSIRTMNFTPTKITSAEVFVADAHLLVTCCSSQRFGLYLFSLEKPFIRHYEFNCHGHSFYFLSGSCSVSTLPPSSSCTGLQASRQRAPCRDGHHSRELFRQLSLSPACAA